MKALIPLLLAVFLIFTQCKDGGGGQFGWSATDDRDIVQPEKGLLMERSYRLSRENLYFFNYETIWWVYRFANPGSAGGRMFRAALYENNNTPNPVEVDLREIPLEKNENFVYIRQQYDPLKPGRYLLKIAHDSAVIDQVEFQVTPPGGPGARSGSRIPEEEEKRPEDGEEDPITKYSS